jgi:alpha-methylacyl-CoA racemase
MTGPLAGVRVVEMAGQGPGPFAGMLLADLGADVVCVDRPTARRHPTDAHSRGRRSIAIDIADPRGRDIVLDLVESADVLVEGFRPGVMERRGLGPDECRLRNPRLVYGRVTGWGQDGVLSPKAGHDINYLALTGGLAAIGEQGRGPVPPLNLVADYGGGGMLLVLGVVAALYERHSSGRGQVIDAAMVDGVGLMLAPFHAMASRGRWRDRGTNLLDGGAPFYRTYRTADNRWLSVGAIEPKFYRAFLEVLGIDETELGDQDDKTTWRGAAERIAAVIATRSRAAWEAAFADVDACVQPVLDLGEAPQHPHLRERGAFACSEGAVYPQPAPRFSRSILESPPPAEELGASADHVLARVGYDETRTAALRKAGVIA